MKKVSLLILLFSTLIQAQKNYDNYDILWKEVIQLEKDNLPKSANTKVGEIFKKAKASNNAPQIVKALMHQSKYALIIEEDAQLNVVHDFESIIKESEFPTKNILESVLAGLYWQYFQQNRWKFYNRTNTSEKVDKSDFRTWDLHTIFNEIHIHYQNSLQNGLLAQQKDIASFNEILHTNEVLSSKDYRPTLYDFLAHNALGFYKTGESNLAQPSYKYELNSPGLLGNNKVFIKEDLTSKDSLSQKRLALELFKNLTLFHLRGNNSKALVDLTRERLQFVKSNARFNDVDAIYLKTLNELSEIYEKDPIVAEIAYLIGLEYQKRANENNPKKDASEQFFNQKAIDVCENALNRFPNSNAANKCLNLITTIKSQGLQLTNEKYVVPNSPNKILVSHKNIDHLYFRLLKVTPNVEEQIQKIYNVKKRFDYLSKFPVISEFNKALKNEKDYKTHTSEVVVPSINQGFYILLASIDSQFDKNQSYAYSFIKATDIALIESNFNRTYRYQVVNRSTGKALVNAKVNLRNKNTNYSNKHIDKTFYTDKDGFISYKSKAHHNRVEIRVDHADDSGLFRYYRLYELRGNENYNNFSNNSVFLFTDRSIYRPSQTVYFKGIAVSQIDNKSQIIADQKLTVTLNDVNYQKVASLDVVTNEYGSFSGEFILPNTGLTGNFEIVVNGIRSLQDKLIPFKKIRNKGIYGSINFSVEEYKRPKFEVTFNQVKETFKLNDTVRLKGVAKAYAGSMITDAKVVFSVKREVHYPRWWYWYRPNYNSEAQEIAHGELKTDDKGEFVIPFLAQPDESTDPKDLPVFNYKITADITDINGETRTASSHVNVGYHTLTAHLLIENKLDKKDKNNKLSLDTKNLNGEFVPTKGSIKIYKLNTAMGVYRIRPWDIPDYQQITEEKYKELFPHEAYSISQDNRGKEVFHTNFDTGKKKEITLNKIKKWESGKYIAVLESKDKFNQKIIDKTQFEVYAENDKKVADKQLFSIQLDKKEYQPGDKLNLHVGSASKDLSLVIDIEKDHKIVQTQIVHLSDEIKTIPIKVTEKDRGGFAIHYHLVNYNSFLRGSLIVSIPYPKTELEIESLTFRDKLQPGQEETWSFKIKGSKGDKVAAEVLTSMYDASLDQFKSQYWYFDPIYHRYYYSSNSSNAYASFGNENFRIFLSGHVIASVYSQPYDQLNWFGLSLINHHYYGRGMKRNLSMDGVVSSVPMRKSMPKSAKADLEASPVEEMIVMDDVVKEGDSSLKNGTDKIEEKAKPTDFSNVKIRTNFNETAFFFPHLTTDSEGNISFSFTTPESLTKWKLQLLAHTKDLNSALKSLETVTQKELMLLPNPPRFLRQGDLITFSTKIANISDKELSGNVVLQLFDAITNQPIDTQLNNVNATQSFSLDAKGNTNVSWHLQIPDNVQAVLYKLIAKAGDYADGEQNVLPVLTNRMLVTETLPMWVRSNQTKTFSLDKLKNNQSTSLVNHKLTLEVTSNPAWYAVQALPYLMEYPYECAEQTFSRYYANTLASHIANANPRIQQVFNQWKNSDALLSNLEKNQELKSLIIQETPWLRDAQSETEQKKRIALLFDLNKMKSEQKKAMQKLAQMQMNSGGFPWFKGSRYANRYITQHIVGGIGHLNKLGVIVASKEDQMLDNAIKYLDNQIKKDYEELLKRAHIIKEKEDDKKKGAQLAKDFLASNHTSHFQVHYLYVRSFFKEKRIPSSAKNAVDYYTEQSYEYWKNYNLYTKGLISLVAYRNDRNAIASKIVRSLDENSITNEELGMYWKENTASWFWYQAPIETQALMVEVFSEIDKDIKKIDNLKIWLLKNKQTNRWKTTKATSEAVYALLLQGTDWLETTDFVNIKIGDKTIKPLELNETKVEAGTGYFKTSWSTTEIKPEMAEVHISKESKGIAWGALYWQYFEDLDKITHAKTPLQLSKKLFLKKNEDRGEQLTLITDKTDLHLGDLVRVRIELKVDRVMEFIHMKDMRASGFEPVNVLSQYKWQDGLGYYESTKDAATHFFIDHLPKGVYVFEYDLRVNNAGDFSNGITSIQSMYAPEFSSHSEGIRVVIKD
jgi:uncharacterized protein YfaS (alpha-2-macroglobulin family)